MIAAIVEVVGKVLDKVLPDPKAKAEAMLKLEEMEQKGDLAVIAGQVEINKIEAASSDRFVSGWRPFVGWVCGAGFALQIIILPLLSAAMIAAGHPIILPPLDISLLSTTLLGMLGLGGMRTYEKVKGVATK